PFSANLAGAVLVVFGLALVARDGLMAIVGLVLVAGSAPVVVLGLTWTRSGTLRRARHARCLASAERRPLSAPARGGRGSCRNDTPAPSSPPDSPGRPHAPRHRRGRR